jgi:hypothetical protein
MKKKDIKLFVNSMFQTINPSVSGFRLCGKDKVIEVPTNNKNQNENFIFVSLDIP